ncbi:MAG: nucleotidyltransferase family protein [Acidimicrobiales bacterium]|nr:nucleotidyltransferase family protein [Acidimicrobiales bacterium]
MELASGTTVDDAALAELCRRYGIRHLALFGSALRDELGPDSDIDLLVEFERDRVPGLLRLAVIELDFERLLGRRVDLRTRDDLSPYFRAAVSEEARPIYDAA